MPEIDRGGSPRHRLLGKQHTFRASEPLGETVIRRFAAAIGDRNPRYWEGHPAGGGLVAPPTLIFELTYDVGGEIDPDTGLYGGLSAWAGSPQQLERAGNEYEVFRPARADDVVTIRREIVDVSEKQGKAGTWTFVTTLITYTNQRDELLGIDRETLACRY